MTDDRSRAIRVREVAGAVGEVAATVFLILFGLLAATLLIGTVHFFTEIW
jgi:high-affinity nickel permease